MTQAPPSQRINPKDRDAVLNALRAGVVPKRGIRHVQVGREKEVLALIRDIDRIAEGGGSFRLVLGDFGAGKSFFLSLVRIVAMEKNLVTATADLNPDRRLYGGSGQARSLYNELARNIATRSSPEGGAMPAIIGRFVTVAQQEAKASGRPVEQLIDERLASLSELVGGYDFAAVVGAYWKGHESGNEQLKSDAIRWLRGEFSTRTDARNALGVRTIIDDDSFYDGIKLLARFVRLSGYAGLMCGLDELVNLYKLAQSQSRAQNYEQILRIFNDALQGGAEGLGWVLGGTPECLLDARRGLYSYPALQTRLSENTFAAAQGIADVNGPVIRLPRLDATDLFVLMIKLRDLVQSGAPNMPPVPDEAIHAFLAHCEARIGAAYFQTPRNSIRAFLDLLSVLEQRPDLAWSDLVEGSEIATEVDTDALTEDPAASGDDELATVRL